MLKLLNITWLLALIATVGVCHGSTTAVPTPTTTIRKLPHFLPDSRGVLSTVWDSFPSDNLRIPETGVTRTYELVVTRQTVVPDGVPKSALVINGQSPGPLLEANWGDWFLVKVTNNITAPVNGFSLHWHGLLQQETPWFDGVPGISQCPISPGKSFTYTFRADQYGTSWYHSHYAAQYTDGALGPMVIYGPVQRGFRYDGDLGIFAFRDYQRAKWELHRDDSFKLPPIFHDIDNNLLNDNGCNMTSGKCDWESSNLDTYRIESGKSYRMRLLNVGAAGPQKISVDRHSMTVISKDLVPIVPYETNILTLGVGQRVDVILQATGDETDAVYIRGQIDEPCTNATAIHGEARAILLYESAPSAAIPTSCPHLWQPNGCIDDPIELSVPWRPEIPDQTPTATQIVNLDAVFNVTGAYVFTINNSSFRANYNRPLLQYVSDGDISAAANPESNIYNFGSNATVRLVLYSYAPFMHPMHLHGHNFWILAQGHGKWDGKITNPRNPLRRDTVSMPPGFPDKPAYLVLQWKQDNPGIWPFHCHMALHAGHGLVLNAMEHPKKIREYQVPDLIPQTCKDWAAWSLTNPVDQTDSGI